MRSTVLRFGSLLAILVLILAACGGTGQSQAPGGSEPAASEPAAAEPVEINWFCCLGAGDDPAQVPTEEAVVDAFNESHDDIELVLEIVDYDTAFDVMSTEIAGGNAPDIVGPVGVSGAEAFHGQWLDLTDLIDSTGYDLSQFAAGLGRVLQCRRRGPDRPPVRQLPVDALLPSRHVRRGRPRVPAARVR